jgi:uncharacterized protein
MLKERIHADATGALKKGDKELAGVLRLVLAAIGAQAKEQRYKISSKEPGLSNVQLDAKAQLDDDQVVDVITAEIKKRRDAITLYEKGNRPELAKREKREIEIMQTYLPEQLSAEALKELIKESVAKTGAQNMKDMGKVMAEVLPKVKGKAESGQISMMVKDILRK